MGLSGTLEAFPLSEVLRLLARSGQTGRLYAQSGAKEMRAYLLGGRLVVAWDGPDEGLGDELVTRGLLDAASWDTVASGDLRCEEVLLAGVSTLDFDKAVLDITTEGLAKMVDGRSGTFAFEEGITTRLRLRTELDLDAVLEGVDARLASWRRLRSIVPDTSAQLVFHRAVVGETVQLSHTAWNLLVSLLPSEPLESIIARTERSSTSVIGDMLELFEAGRAGIDGYVSPSDLEAEPGAIDESDEGSRHLAYVGDDPLGGIGPIGWENELLAIPADDETDADNEDSLPLIGEDEAPFLADVDDSPDGFDFGLVGFDVAPAKGRNLLEKDNTWDAFSDFLGDTRPAGSANPSLVSPDMDEELGSVLDRLDEVLGTGGEEPSDDEAGEHGDSVGEAADDGTAAERMDSPGDPEPGEYDLDDTDDTDDSHDEHSEADDVDDADSLTAFASVLSLLEHAGGDDAEADMDEDVDDIPTDTTESADLLPYDDADPVTDPEPDEDAGKSAVDEADADSDDEDAPNRGFPYSPRRRSRGALARELRSLSD